MIDSNQWWKSIKNDNAHLVQALLSKDPTHVHLVDTHGRTGLILACECNRSTPLVDVLLSFGSNINAQDDRGKTALMHSVSYGRIEVVRSLLRLGSDVTIEDYLGYTALKLASWYNQIQVALLLLEAGADVNHLFLSKRHLIDSLKEQAISTWIQNHLHELSPENVAHWKKYRLQCLLR